MNQDKLRQRWVINNVEVQRSSILPHGCSMTVLNRDSQTTPIYLMMPSSSMLNSLRREGGSLWCLSKPRLLAPWIRHSSQAGHTNLIDVSIDTINQYICYISLCDGKTLDQGAGIQVLMIRIWNGVYVSLHILQDMLWECFLMSHKDGWIFLLKTFSKENKSQILTSYKLQNGICLGSFFTILSESTFYNRLPKPKSQHHNDPLEAHYLPPPPFFLLFIISCYWWFFKK